jgi:hypothetical protein
MTDVKLWSKIATYQLDDPDSEFKFSDRLVQENLGWTRVYALRVMEEYKRFIFLGCRSVGPVTPSDEVDQVWHLHMLYTRQYEEFCNLIGRKFHHGPTKGGKQEDDTYEEQYEYTKYLYYEMFGQYPPVDIWPLSIERFYNWQYKRVSLVQNWVIPVEDWKSLLHAAFRVIRRRCFGL